MINLELAKEVAINAVTGAGDILMANLYEEKRVSFKGPNDIVTHVDIASEKLIMDLIQKNFPDHSILSEESGFTDKKSEYTWILDPIDGTANYYHGYDPFCVALGLAESDEMIINAIYNPVRSHLYFAEKGKGTTLNGKTIKVSDKKMDDALITMGISSKKENRDRLIPNFEKIHSSCSRVRMPGSGLSSIAYVGDGTSEAYFSIKTNPWDILPSALLVTEAGGKVTDINGGELNLKSTSVLATNGIVHEEMLSLLKDI
jgi:myo-inositol-1(or 4)-monophosphatase